MGIVKRSISKLFENLADILIEPVLFAYLLFAIFPRIQAIIDNSVSLEDFKIIIKWDVLMYPFWYIGLGVIFIIWIVYRIWKRIGDQKLDEKIDKILDLLSELPPSKLGGNSL